jgi:hypothetical protein
METIEIEHKSNKKLSSNDQEIRCWTVFLYRSQNAINPNEESFDASQVAVLIVQFLIDFGDRATGQ